MKKLILYVHGQGGTAEEAEHYKPLFPGCTVVGLSYKAETPWEAEKEFPAAFQRLAEPYDSVILIANSIGAYFSMCALPQEKLERNEAVRCLLAAMQALEETDRAILQLQYGQGMTGAQIAAALGLHAATVRQRSRRARQKLKQLLEQEGLTL